MTEEQTQTQNQEGENTNKGQGRAIVLSNGEKRIDYIRRRHYIDGATRSDIAKEVTEMQEKPCPYQIVFSATKNETCTIDGVERTRPESAIAKKASAEGNGESGEDGQTQGGKKGGKKQAAEE